MFPPTLNSSDSKSIIDNSNSSGKSSIATGDGKWIPVPSIAVEDTQQIVHEFSDTDFISFASYVKRRIHENNNLPVEGNDDNSLDEYMLERFSKILAFLKRYIVHPHSNYDHIIDLILKHVYIGVSNLMSSGAFSVHRMLLDAGLVGTPNAYLDSGLILDHDNGMIVDEYTDQAQKTEESSLIDDSILHLAESHKKWPRKIPVYAFYSKLNPNTEIKSDTLQSQLAVSIETDPAQNSSKWKLHIHIPNIASWYAPTSRTMAIGLRRVRTVWLPEGIRHLFPDQVLDRASFSIEKEMEESEDSQHDDKYTRCLTFSVEMDGWSSTSWGPQDASVSLTLIPNKNINFFALEDLSVALGWAGADGQHNQSHLDPFEQEAHGLFDLSPNDVFLGGLKDDLTISGDTETNDLLERDASFSESPMGFRAQSPHAPRQPATEIDISPLDKKNIETIHEVFQQNYWKRIEEGQAVYETETDQYLVTIGSKRASSQLGIPTDRLLLNNTPQSDSHIYSDKFLLTEGNILAGEVAAVFGARENIPLLYEKQRRIQSFVLGIPAHQQEQDGTGSEGTELLRDSAGLLTRAGRYLAGSSQYLGPRETTAVPSFVHFGLGLAAGFAGVARPFDDMRHVMNQWQLTTTLVNAASPAEPWRRLSAQELQLVHDTQLSPRTHALNQLEEVSQRYWALKWLEQEVTRYGGYFVFRCVVVSPQSAPRSYEPRPSFARVYCVELGFEVDLMLPPSAAQSRATPRKGGLLGYFTKARGESEKTRPAQTSLVEEDSGMEDGAFKKMESAIAMEYQRKVEEENGYKDGQDGEQVVLKSGDRIISTDILELDPVRGHLVLGM